MKNYDFNKAGCLNAGYGKPGRPGILLEADSYDRAKIVKNPC